MTQKLINTILFSAIMFSSVSVLAQDIGIYSMDDLLNIRINSASKYAQTISEAPSSVSIVTSEDIQNYGYETLADVLESVTGFYTSYDRNYSYAGVRGFGRPTDYNNRILFQVNGFSINENVFGSAFIGTTFPINPDSIERIEIIRGPGSSLYGTSAMFAVVNVITKTGNTIDGIGMTAEAGNYGKKRSSVLYGMKSEHGIDFSVSGVVGDVAGDDQYYKEYEDPLTNNGVAEGIDGDRYLNINTSLKLGDVTFFGTHSDRTKMVPTGSWGTDFNNRDNKTLDRNSLFGITYGKSLSNSQKVQLRGYYNQYYYEAGYPYLDDPETSAVFYDSAHGEWYGGEVQYTHDTGPSNRLVTGIEYRNNDTAHYKYWGDGSVWYDDNTSSSILSVYVQDTYQIRDDIAATVGLRIDSYSNYGEMISPRIALIYNPYYKTTIKLLHGTAFRVPNVYEAKYEEIDYWKKNDDLKEERIRTTEIIWEQRITNNIMSSVSMYMYKMNDMIDIIFDETDDLFCYDNFDEATAHGLEIGIDARFTESRNLYANYSLQKTKDGNNVRLTNSPVHLVKCGYTQPVSEHINVATEIRYETGRKTVYDTDTDSFLLTNIRLSTKKLYNHYKLSLLVRNVFDTSYSTPGGFEHIQDSISQDGRNYILKVHINF